MSTTDKQGTNRSLKSAKREKMININELVTKLQATAEMMRVGLGFFGAKLVLQKVTYWV